MCKKWLVAQLVVIAFGVLSSWCPSAHAQVLAMQSTPRAKGPRLTVRSSFQDGGSLVMDYVAGSFAVKQDDSFAYISMPGTYRSFDKGRPDLPVIRKEIEVPSEHVLVRLGGAQFRRYSSKHAGLHKPVFPSMGSIEKIPGAFEAQWGIMDGEIYNRDAFYPSNSARVVQVGSVRGKILATVELAPLQYNPVTQEIRSLESATLEVYVAPSVDGDFREGQVRTGTPISSRPKMLVIAGDSLASNSMLADYLNLKKNHGIDSEIIRVSSIGASDVAIRNYLMSRYRSANSSSPLTYVMIVGDVEMVPVHVGGPLTDNFYASLDNDDYTADTMYPDIGVGRLAVKSEAELNVVMTKLLRYEQTRSSGFDWIKKMAFLATDDRYTVAEGTHNYVIDSYTKKLGYSGIFPSSHEQGGDKLYAITHKAAESDVARSMNEGRVLISYSGHGAPTYWAGPRVDAEDVANIPETGAYPYVMSHACVSGSFAMPDQDSFGEIWLKSPHAAIGFFGTSANSYWDEDDILERVFFDGLFASGLKTLSALNQRGLAGVREAFAGKESAPYYYNMYNLLGDPSLELLRTAPAGEVAVGFGGILRGF